MGSVSPVFEKSARTASLVNDEGEAVSVAASLAELFDASFACGTLRASDEALLELLSRSGLLGISVPTEHGGIDVSNTVLAEVCAILGEHSPALGEVVASHFHVLEHIRSQGSDSQQAHFFPAALAGQRFARSSLGDPLAGLPNATPNGLGWNLTGEGRCTPASGHADWILVAAHHERDHPVGLLLQARLEGLRYVAGDQKSPAAGQVFFEGVHVDGDALLPLLDSSVRPTVAHALELLLQSALQLGLARRALRQTLALVDGEQIPANRGANGFGDRFVRIGAASVRLSAAEALIEKAGKAVDAAQIGTADLHRHTAVLDATAADVTAAEAAKEARSLFEDLVLKGFRALRASGATREEGALLSPEAIEALLRSAGSYRLSEPPGIEQ